MVPLILLYISKQGYRLTFMGGRDVVNEPLTSNLYFRLVNRKVKAQIYTARSDYTFNGNLTYANARWCVVLSAGGALLRFYN